MMNITSLCAVLLSSAVFVATTAAQTSSPSSSQTASGDSDTGKSPDPTSKRATKQAVKDLPRMEIAAQGQRRATLAVFLSGDGGWVDIDKKIAEVLSTQGIDVIGVDSRAYLAKGRSPNEVAVDVERIIRTYLHHWNDSTLVLIGYSRGADLGPFIASRLPADLKSHTALLALLGLSTTASFKFHAIDLIRDVARPTDVPIKPELEKLKTMRILCVYGIEEKSSGCKDADSTHVKIVAKKGGHHFDRNYPGLAALILDEL